MRAILSGHPPFQMHKDQARGLCFDFPVLQSTWNPHPSLRPAAQELAASVKSDPEHVANVADVGSQPRRCVLCYMVAFFY